MSNSKIEQLECMLRLKNVDCEDILLVTTYSRGRVVGYFNGVDIANNQLRLTDNYPVYEWNIFNNIPADDIKIINIVYRNVCYDFEKYAVN